MIRPILRYGADTLHCPAASVDRFDPVLHSLVDDMIETMHAASGVGLAAPQIGVGQRLFVADPSSGRSSADLIVVINPRIVERDGAQREDEGCLSLPGFTERVTRASRVVVEGLDRDGAATRLEGSGLLARVLQHEIDHLDGMLFVNRLHGITRDLIVRKVRKLRRSGKW